MFSNSISVKIAFTFTLFSTAVSVIIFSALSFLIIKFLESEDLQQMDYQLQVLEAKYYKGGLNLILSDLDFSDMMYDGKPYFIRLQKGISVFEIIPGFWKRHFNYALLNDRKSGEIVTLTSNSYDFNLKVLTYRTEDNTIFQIGVSDQFRRQLERVLKEIFFILLIPLIIISMLFGLWYSKNALKPVLDLTKNLKVIIKTGKREQKTIKYSTNDELSELVTLFSTLFDKNENLIKGMKETLDNVSHDLRTPLTRIRVISEVALTNSEPEAMKDALSDSIEEIDSIIKILNALLDITASENGVLNLDLKEFNIRELLDRSIELYSFVAEDKMIKLLLKYNLNRELITGDEVKLGQAVANILDNAVKYSDKGGVIDITVDNEENNITISIKDSGMGISEDEILSIWDRLFRSTRSRNEPGLGLGLSMVKAIITAHKGSVVVKSKLHEGSTFIISIPLQISNNSVIK